MARFEEIAAGLFNTCGITEAGRLYCWGGNSTGVLPGVSDLDHGPVEIVVPDPN